MRLVNLKPSNNKYLSVSLSVWHLIFCLQKAITSAKAFEALVLFFWYPAMANECYEDDNELQIKPIHFFKIILTHSLQEGKLVSIHCSLWHPKLVSLLFFFKHLVMKA